MNQTSPLTFHPPSEIDPTLDGRRLRRAWRRAEPESTGAFNKLAEIDAMLVDRLDEIKVTPARMLDLGCRSGTVSRLLRQRWPKAQLVSAGLEHSWMQRYVAPSRMLKPGSDLRLVMEGPQLPLQRNRFDLVVSGMALQWMGDLDTLLKEIRRVLRPDGLFLAVIPGRETLQELHRCMEELDQTRHERPWPHRPPMPEIQELGDRISGAGLALTVVDRIAVQPRFSSVAELLRTLKQIGGGNHHRQRAPGLMGKGFPAALAERYETHYGGGSEPGLPATLELLFCHAWKAPQTRKA